MSKERLYVPAGFSLAQKVLHITNNKLAAASGYLELAEIANEPEKTHYIKRALEVQKSLCEHIAEVCHER